MAQSRAHSFVESWVNVLIGYFVSLASQILVFPMFGIDVTLRTNLGIGAWFTLISLIRSYVIRRCFTKHELG